ncbi:MAG TPA: FAD-dependent monooxygenase [Ktedonobacteraceae bacterium]|nr:FAD-dependent monooxygenase [Ktedonobacteraceae bacterium]
MMHQEMIDIKQYVSVIIVGAGPTGLTLGNLLGLQGVDTLILERNPALNDFPRAIAIDDEGLRVLQAAGLLEPMLRHILLNVSAHYVSGKRLFARVAPTANRNGFPLISTFHQPEFEAILLAGLKRFTCVDIAFQHTVETFEQSTQNVAVTVRAPDGSLKTMRCAYLLACDGGKSSIRKALGIPMQGSTYSQKWLVIDSIQDEQPSTTITFFCNPRRPAVTVPAPQQRRRWEFMLLPGEQEAKLLQPETIRKLIVGVGAAVDEGKVPLRSPSISPMADEGKESLCLSVMGTHNPQITRQAIYTFHALLAKTFSKGRVFLLGDAAHQMPPFGGQAMNSGLRDAHNLSWKLSLVLQGLANPSLLDTYNVERREHAAQMIRLSRFAGSIVMPISRPVAFLRDILFLALNTIPAIREYLTEMRIKPQPRYKKGFFLTRADESAVGMVNQPLRGMADESAVGAINRATRRVAAVGPDLSRAAPIHRPMAGLMLPQPEVTTLQGDKVLLDEVLGPGFALLRYLDALQEDALNAFPDQEIWTELAIRRIGVLPARSSEPASVSLSPVSTQIILIRSDPLSIFLRHNPDLFLLVRPDRYIFGAFRSGQAAAFATAFQRMLQAKDVRDG